MDIENDLKALDVLQISILFWKAKGLSDKEIGKKFGNGEDWVQARMTEIYKELGFEPSMHSKRKKQILEKDYFPVVLALTGDNHDNTDDWPKRAKTLEPEKQKTISSARPTAKPVDQNRPKQTAPASAATAPVDQNRPRSRSIWTWLWIPIVLLIAGALYGAYWLGVRGSSQALVPTNENPGNVQNLNPTNTQMVVSQPAVASTETLSVPTESPVVVLSDTPLPSETPTPSPIPTVPVAFFDDFESGLNPAWTVLFGTPVTSNGQLQAGELTLLSVGDTAWTDYQVDFDVTMIRDCMHDPSFIGIRASDRDNMLLYEFDACDSEWNSVNNGNWTAIPGTRLGNQGFVETKVHFTITAKGDQIVLYAGSNRLNSFTDPYNHLSGNIYLRIKPGDVFDNFKVTLLK